jgi:hypothetical protein
MTTITSRPHAFRSGRRTEKVAGPLARLYLARRQAWHLAIGLWVALSACSSPYKLDQASAMAGAPSSGGQIFAVQLTAEGVPAGSAVAFSALPSTITVSPAMVTVDSQQHVLVYALVPFGVEGTVLGATPLAQSISIPVGAAPLVICPAVVTPIDSGNALGVAGRVYSVSAMVMVSGDCNQGTAAPAGIGVTFTASQPAQAGMSTVTVTAMTVTDTAGKATANLEIPWGPEVAVQAVGGGGISTTELSASYNPLAVSCVSWADAGAGLYQVTAMVVDGTTPIAAAPVSFTVTIPGPSAASVNPSSTSTNEAGLATTLVAVPDGGVLPVVVEATSGNSVFPVTISSQGSGDGGTCGVH